MEKDNRNNFQRWYDYAQPSLSSSSDSYLRAFLAGMTEALDIAKGFSFRNSRQGICQDCSLVATEEISKRIAEMMDKFRREG